LYLVMKTNINKSKAYLVGGGIASLASAAYLIRDANFLGKNIYIFDSSKTLGGSLDARNLPSSEGYVMRGIRMFEEKAFTCTFDLMSFIPSLIDSKKTIRDEFVDFNKNNKTYSKSRLLKNGKVIDSRPLGLNLKDKFNLFRLLARRENSLGTERVEDFFTPSFFKSNFWFEFCTAFSFQPWHSLVEFRRYFLRFIQDFPVIDTFETIEITPYNQYESMILPIVDYLTKRGVNFVTNTSVTNLDFRTIDNLKKVSKIYYKQDGKQKEISVNENDYVFVTLGSITADSSIGSMTEAPRSDYGQKSAAWYLWENIAKDQPDFGKPSVFNSDIDKSKWISFTTTFRDPIFFKLMEKFINKKISTYGGVNLIDSNWLISMVLSYKHYFIDQPKDITLSWGYGLYPDNVGNFVHKKMSECNGKEILTELCQHLGFKDKMELILKTSTCIPCLMPYITSQFLPREKGDRPLVIPKNSNNLAFIGQYCEIPDDVVFTVEYSIRSAQTAVYSLLNLNKKVAPLYNGTHHAKVLYNAITTIFR